MEIRALRDTHHEMIFDNKSASGSEWSHMVYTFFDTNITDIDRGQFRCFLSCYSDETPCDGFVYIHPLCYKTSWYINSTVANVATVATWFYRIRKSFGLSLPFLTLVNFIIHFSQSWDRHWR